MKQLKTLLSGVICMNLFWGCGSAPDSKIGNDQGNTKIGNDQGSADGLSFSLTINGQLETFNSTSSTLNATDNEMRLILCGDKLQPDLVDADFHLCLHIDLLKKEFFALQNGSDLIINSETFIDEDKSSTSAYSDFLTLDEFVLHTAKPDQHQAIKQLWMQASCNCFRGITQNQDLQGTLHIVKSSTSELEGKIDLTLKGAIPFYKGPQEPEVEAVLHATFNAKASN